MSNITETYVKKDGIWTPSKNVYIKKDGAWKEGNLKLKANGEWIEKQQSSYDPVLANNTWEQIAQAAKEGVAKDIWKVGDAINVNTKYSNKYESLGDISKSLVYRIIGFDHTEPDSSISPITFCADRLVGYFSNVISGNSFNETTPYTGYYQAMDILPSDVMSVIKSVKKNFLSRSATANIQDTKLFPLSATELGIQNLSNDGIRYEYFDTTDIRKKLKASVADTSTVYAAYFTRTPMDTALAKWYAVSTSGTSSTLTCTKPSSTSNYKWSTLAFVIG